MTLGKKLSWVSMLFCPKMVLKGKPEVWANIAAMVQEVYSKQWEPFRVAESPEKSS